MKITIPELSFVVLIGASGAGKSSFARRHFLPTETLSSDFCRGLVSDDENSLEATTDAFDVLHFIAAKRLAAGKLTVVDATNVQPEARAPLVELARRYHCLPVAIVLDMPERLCLERNETRSDRNFGPHVVRNHARQLRRSIRNLRREGFRHVFVLSSPEEVEAASIERQPLWNNKKNEHGPFDIIGDVHGCCDELESLLRMMGYENEEDGWRHASGRRTVFVGDLVDRGPRIADTLRLVMAMVEGGAALCVPGNHDIKLLRKLNGKDVKIAHGLAETLAELEREPPEFIERVKTFLDGLISHYVFDDGRLVVAHAGLKQTMQGRGSGRVRDFALYGETTGETDEFGLPVRYPWAKEYRGRATVVYGHTPVPQAEWLNNTINVDTGCVFGGALTALRYPEMELVAVPAAREYAEPARPFLPVAVDNNGHSAQQQHDDVLDMADVSGKRLVTTTLHGNVTIREENSIAALEVMSRFAADPKWLIYLPPTMSPCETTRQPGLLEHPEQAFRYYHEAGIERVVCEEKHMGSRAVVVVCRDAETARRRFGVAGQEAETAGICVTRTGRRFFSEADTENALLSRVRGALDAAGFWQEFETDWVCLDCELMPWSAKAQELITRQYAPVGAAARASLHGAQQALERAAQREHGMVPSVNGSVETVNEQANEAEEAAAVATSAGLKARFDSRLQMAQEYVAAYQRYCWDVASVADLKLAPFHILATEGRVHSNQNHIWHMETLARVCEHDDILLATPFRVIELNEEISQADGIAWWEELTARGGEGMVVKPLDFVAHSVSERGASGEAGATESGASENATSDDGDVNVGERSARNRSAPRGPRGLVQPAVKCRGREYLRIIYGPEYSSEEHLKRLRSRGLSAKRSLALREFALGLEALERFVKREPLRRVHECVFGVLALESEPVDPRL